MNRHSLEIERRFHPPPAGAGAGCPVQPRLSHGADLSPLPPHQTERVRRREGADGVVFFHTVKIDRSAITRLEQEEITPRHTTPTSPAGIP